jgi:hypothetical protein
MALAMGGRPEEIMESRKLVLLAFGAAVMAAPAFAAPTPLVHPKYTWLFERFESDSLGSVLLPAEEIKHGGQQDGAPLDETYVFGFTPVTPHLEAYSNADATTFWTAVRSPGGDPDLLGVPLGARSTLTIEQRFLVGDEPDPSLSFTISQIALDASDPPGGPGNDGLSAYLFFEVEAQQDIAPFSFFRFADDTRLSGYGLDWEVDDLGGPLQTIITRGAENEPRINVRLDGPFTQEIDLSLLLPGEAFTLRYTIVAEAIDTEQFDSRISAYARDPLSPASGSFFEFSGLIPLASVPEPGTALLVGIGLALVSRSRAGAPARSRSPRTARGTRSRSR